MHLDLTQLPAFLLACTVVVLTPGVDAFLLLRTSVRAGTRAGLLALAGIYAASAVQVGLVVSGLGVLLAERPALLTGLRWVGAGYLAYLAFDTVRGLVRARADQDGAEPAGSSPGHPFRRGFLTNITNPKMLLFSLAFLPQFVGTGTPAAQLALLGLVFLGLGVSWELVIVLAAGRVAGRLRRPGMRTALDATCAAVFTAMSVALLV